MTKKLRIAFITLAALIIAFMVAGRYLAPQYQPLPSPTPTKAPEKERVLEKVSLDIVYEGSKDTFNFDYEEGLTAFDLLQKASKKDSLEIETQRYDFGIFVKSIKGLESTSDMAWIYFVNGESASVAADKYELEPGDKVEWKYIEPANNN